MSIKTLTVVFIVVGTVLVLTLITLLNIQSEPFPAGSWVGVVINIPRQQLLNPLIIVNGELVNITVQDPLYMFHHYGFSPYTLNMVETVNLNGSRYTVYAVITEAAMAVVGYNQTGKYYQFPAGNNLCPTLPFIINVTIRIPNSTSTFMRGLMISKIMNSITNETLNMRLGRLTVSQCLSKILIYYFTVIPQIKSYLGNGHVRLASYGIYWSGHFKGNDYVAISIGYEFVFNALSENGTRIGIIIANIQYQNGSIIISVRLIPRTKVLALNNIEYTIENASLSNWAGYSVSISSGDDLTAAMAWFTVANASCSLSSSIAYWVGLDPPNGLFSSNWGPFNVYFQGIYDQCLDELEWAAYPTYQGQPVSSPYLPTPYSLLYILVSYEGSTSGDQQDWFVDFIINYPNGTTNGYSINAYINNYANYFVWAQCINERPSYSSGVSNLAIISLGYVLVYDIAFYDNNLGEWISPTSLSSPSYTAYAITMNSCPGMIPSNYGQYEMPSGFPSSGAQVTGFENQYTNQFCGG